MALSSHLARSLGVAFLRRPQSACFTNGRRVVTSAFRSHRGQLGGCNGPSGVYGSVLAAKQRCTNLAEYFFRVDSLTSPSVICLNRNSILPSFRTVPSRYPYTSVFACVAPFTSFGRRYRTAPAVPAIHPGNTSSVRFALQVVLYTFSIKK